MTPHPPAPEPDDDVLRRQIRRHATRHAAPEALRAGLRTQLALAEARQATPPATATHALARPPWPWTAGLLGAGAALGLACALWLPLQRSDTGGPVTLADATLVQAHVQALRAGPLTQVLSTDRHTVKPWFQGRLSFAPTVVDLASDGFPLLGGRISTLQGQTLAVLTYTRDRHIISLFIEPGSTGLPLQQQAVRGFHLVHWGDGAMSYWAVSDLAAGELARFAQRWSAQAAAQ
jgi:anti-sigma factor RsiW